MDAETRKRLEQRASDDAEAADGWELAGCEAARVRWLREKSADIRAALAEIDRLEKRWDSIQLVSSRYYELSLRAVGGIGRVAFGPEGFGRLQQ